MTSVFLTNTVANVEIAPELGGAILAYHVKLNSQFIPILRNASKAKSVHESCCFPLVPYSNQILYYYIGQPIVLYWTANRKIAGIVLLK